MEYTLVGGDGYPMRLQGVQQCRKVPVGVAPKHGASSFRSQRCWSLSWSMTGTWTGMLNEPWTLNASVVETASH